MTHNAFSNPGAGGGPAADRPFARCGFRTGELPEWLGEASAEIAEIAGATKR
jgi:hypothetical protein